MAGTRGGFREFFWRSVQPWRPRVRKRLTPPPGPPIRAGVGVGAAPTPPGSSNPMARLPHPALAWTANLLVPGAGLVLLGRLVSGLLLGLVWGLALAGLLVATLVWPDAVGVNVVAGLGLAAALAYVGAQILHHVWRGRAAAHLAGETRDATFRRALVAYLQGRFDDADAACRALLRRDPDDVEATLHLASIARRGHCVPGPSQVRFRRAPIA